MIDKEQKNKADLSNLMRLHKDKETINPLFVEQVNNSFIVAAYQGALSEFDVLIKYRQRIKNKWSRPRTPKHIHWAVDILIKMNDKKEKTKKFLSFLMSIWEKTKAVKSEKERKEALKIENLLFAYNDEIDQYGELSKSGEYSIRFLILLAKLLMIQEKTNKEDAYMFKNLLKALSHGEQIFKIVSIASLTRGRK